jgi:hypothetical protein
MEVNWQKEGVKLHLPVDSAADCFCLKFRIYPMKKCIISQIYVYLQIEESQCSANGI